MASYGHSSYKNPGIAPDKLEPSYQTTKSIQQRRTTSFAVRIAFPDLADESIWSARKAGALVSIASESDWTHSTDAPVWRDVVHSRQRWPLRQILFPPILNERSRWLHKDRPESSEPREIDPQIEVYSDPEPSLPARLLPPRTGTGRP